MNISFTEKCVGLATDFDLTLTVGILRVLKHAVSHLQGAHIRPSGHDNCPGEALADRGCCRDDNAAEGASLAFYAIGCDHHPVVKHLDRERVFRRIAHVIRGYPTR